MPRRKPTTGGTQPRAQQQQRAAQPARPQQPQQQSPPPPPQQQQPAQHAAAAQRQRVLDEGPAQQAVADLIRHLARTGDAAELRACLAAQADDPSDEVASAVLLGMEDACGGGHSECLQALLDVGYPPPTRALTVAILRGQPACVRLLLAAGCAPTPEAVVAAAGQPTLECLQALLAAGGSAAAAAAGTTPLHAAMQRLKGGDAERTAALLLSQGADPNALNAAGETPLALALALAPSRWYTDQAVCLLLREGAKPNAAGGKGTTLMLMLDEWPSLWEGCESILHAAVRAGAALDVIAPHSGLTALERLQEYGERSYGDDSLVERALDAMHEARLAVAAANVFRQRRTCSLGCRWYDAARLAPDAASAALHRAVACDQPGRLLELLEQGLPADGAGASGGITPLLRAAWLGRERCLRTLLRAGADASAAADADMAVVGADADEDGLHAAAEPLPVGGSGALWLASAAGNWHCLRALIAAGADVDAANGEGRTALHASAAAGHEACLVALLEAGADVQARDAAGLTPLQCAAAAGQEHCVWTLLLAPGCLPGEEEAGALVAGAMAALRLGAEAGGRDESSPVPAAAPAAQQQQQAAAAALDEALLAEVTCPITQEPMADPVMAADGTTYERQAIEDWIALQRRQGLQPTSPTTGLPLESCRLIENRMARGLITGLRAAGLLS